MLEFSIFNFIGVLLDKYPSAVFGGWVFCRRESIAGYHPHNTAIRFYPHRRVYLIPIAPSVDYKFAVLVKMSLIHANNVPPGKFRRRVHNCQPWLHIVKRRLWTEEKAVIGADKIELILIRLNY